MKRQIKTPDPYSWFERKFCSASSNEPKSPACPFVFALIIAVVLVSVPFVVFNTQFLAMIVVRGSTGQQHLEGSYPSPNGVWALGFQVESFPDWVNRVGLGDPPRVTITVVDRAGTRYYGEDVGKTVPSSVSWESDDVVVIEGERYIIDPDELMTREQFFDRVLP